MKKLIIAYGNPDRQDDGAGWYVLKNLARNIGRKIDSFNEDYYSELGHNPDLFYILQLTPELAEIINNYEAICFIDASVELSETVLRVQSLSPKAVLSPLSHHLSPQTLLEFAFHIKPSRLSAWLLTVPGTQFGFAQELTVNCRLQADKAVSWLVEWVNGN